MPELRGHAALPGVDQAHGLRRLFDQHDVRLLPVVAQAGDVDALPLAIDIAMRWAQDERHVLLLDASEPQGAALVADAAPAERAGEMLDLMQGHLGYEEVLEPIAPAVWRLPAHQGLCALVEQGVTASALFDAAASLPLGIDMVIVLADAPTLAALCAGEETAPLVPAADDATGMTRAYAAIKTLATQGGLARAGVVMTDRGAPARALAAAQRLAQCAQRFLQCDAHLAAMLPLRGSDLDSVLAALSRRALDHAVRRDACRAVARRLLGEVPPTAPGGSCQAA